METEKRNFIMSWARFVVVCSFLAVVNLVFNPHNPWILWILGGWGISQVLNTVDYYLKTR